MEQVELHDIVVTTTEQRTQCGGLIFLLAKGTVGQVEFISKDEDRTCHVKCFSKDQVWLIKSADLKRP